MCVRSHLYLSAMLARSRCCAAAGTMNAMRNKAKTMRRTIKGSLRTVRLKPDPTYSTVDPRPSRLLYTVSMQAPSTPIIVKIVETNEVAGLGDVMVEALGLTGAISVGALLFGLMLA